MKPRRQKKYVTREQILKDIHAAHRKLSRLTHEAAELSVAAEFQKVLGNHTRFVELSEQADDLLKRCERLTNTRLKKLGATLAAFDTKPMFGDEQVVLQRLHD